MTIYSPNIEEDNLLITGSWDPFIYCQAMNNDFGTFGLDADNGGESFTQTVYEMPV